MDRIRSLVRIMVVGVLFMLGGISACGGGVDGTLSLIETPAASSTLINKPTLTPTVTATSTLRPTFTPTFIADAYLTPTTPEADTKSYRLVEWTPQRADELIRLLEEYVFEVPGPDINYTWQQISGIVAEVQAELVLRFPNSPNADRWRWDIGYSLSYGFNSRFVSETSEYFAELITGALNSGEKSLDEIPVWAAQSVSGTVVEITDIGYAPSGYSDTYIISVNKDAFIWLLRDEKGEYKFQSLLSVYYFDNRYDSGGFALVEDLTGDGIPEIIVDVGHYGNWYLSTYWMQIFSITQYPAVQLDIYYPNIGFYESINFSDGYFGLTETHNGKLGLRVESSSYECGYKFIEIYQWNGEWVEAVKSWIEDPPAGVEDLRMCLSEMWPYYLIDRGNITFLEAVLPIYPPQLEDFTYPPDALDELRFHLGLLYALEGNSTQAISYMEGIITEPSVLDSGWIRPAREFLEVYESEMDLYHACKQINFCDLKFAMEYVVNNIPEGADNELVGYIKELGISILSSGYFDFDGDWQAEQWVVIQPRNGEDLEFWILAKAQAGMKALFASTVFSTNPSITLYKPIKGRNLIQLENQILFTFHRVSTSGNPYVFPVEMTNIEERANQLYIPDFITVALKDLMAGADPNEIVERLLAIQSDPNFELTENYYYYLGLAYELAGDEEAAIEAYLKQWENFPYKIRTYFTGDEFIIQYHYTLMARFKLELVP